MTRRLIATLATTAAFLAVCASADALYVQAPGTQVSIEPGKGISVTAPGTEVSIGPGGTSVNVDPGKAASGSPPAAALTQPPLPGPAPASEESSPAPQPSPAPSGGNRTGDGKDSSQARARPGPGEANPGTGSAQASSTRAPAAAQSAAGATRPAESPPARDAGGAAEKRATKKAAPTSAVQRIVERVPAELLAALALVSLIAAAMSLVWLRERSRVRAATRQAQVDPLTGIPNRLAFENRLGHEFKRARRYERPLGMLMLDLDGLKQVNDTKGHDAGDQMIRATADLISGDIRESDLAARLAGDEFVVLCPESPGEGLQQLSTKLHNRLEFAGIDASIGWAELTDSDMRAEDMMQRADESMYREKGSRAAARRAPISSQGLATAG